MAGNWWVVLDYGDGGFQSYGRPEDPNAGYETRKEAEAYVPILAHNVGKPGSIVYLAPEAVRAFNALGYGGNRK